LAKIYEAGVPPYINQDFAYARGVLVEASDFGYPPAIYKLGYCYEHGLLGLDVNPVENY
jgi:TPR repeat protein